LRTWRDIGTYILILGIILEGLIDIFWKEKPSIITWDTRTGWQKFSAWWKVARNGVVLATLAIVAVGVGMEMKFGDWADDVADEMRFNLQERVVRLSPRYWHLLTDMGGGDQRMEAKLYMFAGQKIEVVKYASPSEDQEASLVADLLDAVLNTSGWLSPSGQKIIDTSHPGIAYWTNLWTDESRSRWDRNGIAIVVDLKAPAATTNAAKALRSALEAEHVSVIDPSELTPAYGTPQGLKIDSSTIVLTVCRRPLS